MKTGADLNQTYEQFATEMRVGDALLQAKQRYAPH